MYHLGQSAVLPVLRKVAFGYYLDGENLGDILLPNRHAPEELVIGDSLPVFLYLDSEDRLIATSQRPRVEVGQCAYLQVKQTNDIGAFLDWGLDRDLLVPFAEQHQPLEVGKAYIVGVYLDDRDGRIVATTKIDHLLAEVADDSITIGDGVQLIIGQSSELGFKAIINSKFWGLLHEDQVFQRLSFGQKLKGYIQHIREDGKINLTLRSGIQSRDKDAYIILNALKTAGGFLSVHDKSDANEIRHLFGMSKGQFKKTIGHLYKQKDLLIEKTGIRLVEIIE